VAAAAGNGEQAKVGSRTIRLGSPDGRIDSISQSLHFLERIQSPLFVVVGPTLLLFISWPLAAILSRCWIIRREIASTAIAFLRCSSGTPIELGQLRGKVHGELSSGKSVQFKKNEDTCAKNLS
jgi:hypothetical protein